MNRRHDIQSKRTATGECPECEFDPFMRNHFFTGKMMGVPEFVTETAYHADRLRHHNARLHGWGVVCGLSVHEHGNAQCRNRFLVVEPGTALDCCGHEILVTEPEPVDVTTFPAVKKLAQASGAALHALQLCIRFRECPTEDVPVLFDDCGCDDTQCLPNRILESYEFDVLVDPPLTVKNRVAPDKTWGAIAASPGIARFSPVLKNGMLYAVAADDSTQLLKFDLVNGSAESIGLGAKALALAASDGGDKVFVVTEATSTTPAQRVLMVFNASSGMKLNNEIALPDSDANSDIRIAAPNKGGAYALITLVSNSNACAIHGWPDDPAGGLGKFDNLGNVPKHLTSFLIHPDGKHGFALDSAMPAQIRLIEFNTKGLKVSDIGVLPENAKPNALAYFKSGTQEVLAVADRPKKMLYLVNVDISTPGNSTLRTSLPLEHEPQLLVAPDNQWLHVYEQEGTAGYLQSLFIAPLAQNGAVLPGTARAAGDKGLNIIPLYKCDGLAARLDLAVFADASCDEVVWRHLHGCVDCVQANCIVLATITQYQYDASMLDPTAPEPVDDVAKRIARIRNRLGRRVLASTQTLQAWIECLQNGGAQGKPGKDGINGKDGLGLFPDLPKIIDIGWDHGEKLDVGDFFALHTDLNSADEVQGRVKSGEEVPPFTIYFNKEMFFGINRETFRLSLQSPFVYWGNKETLEFTGLYNLLNYRYYGNLIVTTGELRTPHTDEESPYAVTFMPHPQVFSDALSVKMQVEALLGATRYQDSAGVLDWPSFQIELKGQFVFAGNKLEDYKEEGVLDADNIGGLVGSTHVRRSPGGTNKNPSGNLSQGGLFESWLSLVMLAEDTNLTPIERLARLHPLTALATPGDLQLATIYSPQDQLAKLPGISDALAKRIVEERRKQRFRGVADFLHRIELSKKAFNEFKDYLIIF